MVAGHGGVAVTHRLVRVAGVAARGKIPGEGIGWCAAKQGYGSDGRARGIEAEMILAGMVCRCQFEVPLNAARRAK